MCVIIGTLHAVHLSLPDEPEMLVYKPYFADEKTEAQKDEVTCPSHKIGWLGDG